MAATFTFWTTHLQSCGSRTWWRNSRSWCVLTSGYSWYHAFPALMQPPKPCNPWTDIAITWDLDGFRAGKSELLWCRSETPDSVHDIVGMVVFEPFTRSNEVGQHIKLGSMPAAGRPKEAGKAFSSTMTKAWHPKGRSQSVTHEQQSRRSSDTVLVHSDVMLAASHCEIYSCWYRWIKMSEIF